MAEPEKNQEQQQKQALPPAVEAPPLDEETKTVLENFDKAKKEKISAMEKTFKDRSSVKLGQIGRSDLMKMMKDEVDAIEQLYQQFKNEYVKRKSQEKLGKLATEVERGSNDQLASKLLEEAGKKADEHINMINTAMEVGLDLKEGQFMAEEQIAQLKPMLEGIKKISESEKGGQLEPVIEKLRTPNAPNAELEAKDYDQIIGIMNPNDLEHEVSDKNKDKNLEGKFEASSFGLIIALMKPAQRFHLVERLMDSPKKSQTVAVIDSFLRTGILNSAQGKQLFTEALSKNLLSREDEKKYQDNIDTGIYLKEAQKVREILQKKATELKGSFATNPVERFFGAPGLGMLMGIHSIMWMLTNLLASGGDLGSLIKNPYFLAAVAEGGFSVEMFTGASKHGGWGIGSGAISGLIERWTGKDAKSAENKAYGFITNVYVNYPDFGSYLEHGGPETIVAVRKAKALHATGQQAQEGQPESTESKEGKPAQKKAKPEELFISFQELYDAEKNPDQKSRLQAAQKNFPQDIIKHINGVAEAMVALKINTPEDVQSFMGKLAELKKQQGLQVAENASARQNTDAKPSVDNFSS